MTLAWMEIEDQRAVEKAVKRSWGKRRKRAGMGRAVRRMCREVLGRLEEEQERGREGKYHSWALICKVRERELLRAMRAVEEALSRREMQNAASWLWCELRVCHRLTGTLRVSGEEFGRMLCGA